MKQRTKVSKVSPICTSPTSQHTADTAMGLLFESVPQLGSAINRVSPKSSLFSSMKLSTLQQAAEVDPTLRRNITSAYLEQRQKSKSSSSSSNSRENGRAPISQYQEIIQMKFKLYSQKTNRMTMLAAKHRDKEYKFTAKDFFNNDRISSPSLQAQETTSPHQRMLRDYPDMTLEQFLVELKHIKNRLLQCIKMQNIKQMPIIFQSLLLEVINTKSALILAHCLFFCGSISLRVQTYKYAVYFFDQCKLVCNFNLRKLIQLKLDTLINLGLCARDLKDYDGAITILKKALQYTWYLNDKSKEIVIYDHLGLAYYYLGNLTKSMLYHHRSTKDQAESDASQQKSLSNEMLEQELDREQELTNTEIISQAMINQLHMPFLQINTRLLRMVEGTTDSPLHRKNPSAATARQSVYRDLFKTNRISLTTNQQFQRDFIETEAKALVNLQLEPRPILARLLIDREFQYTVQTPRAPERAEQPTNGKIYIHQGDKLGPVPVVKADLKYDPKKYKMSLDSLIHFRNESLKLEIPKPNLLAKLGQLNTRVCISHLSKNRGQLQTKGGLVIDDLLKIIDYQYQTLISVLTKLQIT